MCTKILQSARLEYGLNETMTSQEAKNSAATTKYDQLIKLQHIPDSTQPQQQREGAQQQAQLEPLQ